MTSESYKSSYARGDIEFTDSEGITGNGERSGDLERLADLIAERLAVRPLAVDVAGACRALGVSWDFWRAHVQPEIRIARVGRRKLVPIAELERWLDLRSETALPTQRRTA